MRLSRRWGQPHATIGYVNHKPLIVMWPRSWLSYMFISYKSHTNHNVSSFFWVKSAFSYAFPYAFPMVLALLDIRRPHRGRYSIQAIEFNRAEKMNLLGSSGWRRGKLHLKTPLLVVNSG